MNSPCDLNGLIHISGEPASGKTLFAIGYASEMSRKGDVLWVNTNGKMSFLTPLKRTISRRNGNAKSVRILTALGHEMIRQTLSDIPLFLTEDTILVVIDSITRVLNMGLRSEPMWGRVLFEEVLPALTAISMTHNTSILCISECRDVGGSKRAVYQEAMNRFANQEIRITRTRKSGISIAEIESKPLAKISLEKEGSVALALGGAN
jgi:predicted ATP-dependent serine protease